MVQQNISSPAPVRTAAAIAFMSETISFTPSGGDRPVRIRAMRPKHTAEVSSLMKECLPAFASSPKSWPPRLPTLEERADLGIIWLVVEVDGDVVAYAGFRPGMTVSGTLMKGAEVYLDHLAVTREWQGRGLGMALVDAGLEAASLMGYQFAIAIASDATVGYFAKSKWTPLEPGRGIGWVEPATQTIDHFGHHDGAYNRVAWRQVGEPDPFLLRFEMATDPDYEKEKSNVRAALRSLLRNRPEMVQSVPQHILRHVMGVVSRDQVLRQAVLSHRSKPGSSFVKASA